jgi:hypothetical protein
MEFQLMAKKAYKPKEKEVQRLRIALSVFKETETYKNLPDEYKKHL